MDELSTALRDAQRHAARVPVLQLTLSNERLGLPRFAWQRDYAGDGEGDAPVAACLTEAGTLIHAHNDGGTVRIIRVPNAEAGASGVGSLLTDSGATTGTDVALVALPDEVLVAYLDDGGDRIRVRSSTDDGVSWASAVTVLDEGSPIGSLALGGYNGFNDDLAVFYVVGTSSTVKSARRTSGAWDSTGTSWSRGGDVSSLAGIGAWHNGADYVVALAGVASGTSRPTVWTAEMGDFLGFPDTWTGLLTVIDVDGASTVTYEWPDIVYVLGSPLVTFVRVEAGGTAARRVYQTAPRSTSVLSPTYHEPYPLEAANEYGAALAAHDAAAAAFLVQPDGIWVAGNVGASRALDGLVLSARWEFERGRTRARFTLDDSAGEAWAGLRPAAGMDLALFCGYLVDGAEEFGGLRLLTIDRVERQLAGDGRRLVVVDCVGPWEVLGYWRAPRPERFEGGEGSRYATFAYLAGRAGVDVGSAIAPWSGDEPGFSLSPGESGASALLRLSAPRPEGVVHETGALDIVELPDSSVETYGTGGHPVASARLVDAPVPVNWMRLQAEDRYVDAADYASVSAHGPRFGVLRDVSATTDALAAEYAAGALERVSREGAAVELVAPYHVAQRLLDVVTVDLPDLGLDGDYRVTGVRGDYERRPGRSRYDITLTLAEV